MCRGKVLGAYLSIGAISIGLTLLCIYAIGELSLLGLPVPPPLCCEIRIFIFVKGLTFIKMYAFYPSKFLVLG